MHSVLVRAELSGQAGWRAAAALLTLARRIGEPTVVLFGPSDPDRIGWLALHGACQVHLVGESDVDDAAVLAQLAESAAAVLVASGNADRELAARVAVRLDTGIFTDVVDLEPGPVVVQEIAAGPHLVRSSTVGGIPVCVVRTELIEVTQAPATPSVKAVACSAPQRVRVVERIPKVPGRDPRHATVVVAGGHGAADFELVGQVAAALNGALTGSHTAAMQGKCQRSIDQIIHPLLYIAMGISGSVRHRAGMQHAKTIVAIDSDPEAPIFEIADFGIVGDVQHVVPQLLAEIQRQRSGRHRGVEG